MRSSEELCTISDTESDEEVLEGQESEPCSGADRPLWQGVEGKAVLHATKEVVGISKRAGLRTTLFLPAEASEQREDGASQDREDSGGVDNVCRSKAIDTPSPDRSMLVRQKEANTRAMLSDR